MLSYEQWDFIADLYNPLLFIVSVYLPWRLGSAMAKSTTGIWRKPCQWWLESAWGLVVVYGLLALDTHFGWWPSWELDYSTHTGFALVLAANLWRYQRFWLWPVSLPAYGFLMAYQGYHTWGDMISTSVVVGLLFGVGLVASHFYWSSKMSNATITEPG